MTYLSQNPVHKAYTTEQILLINPTVPLRHSKIIMAVSDCRLNMLRAVSRGTRASYCDSRAVVTCGVNSVNCCAPLLLLMSLFTIRGLERWSRGYDPGILIMESMIGDWIGCWGEGGWAVHYGGGILFVLGGCIGFVWLLVWFDLDLGCYVDCRGGSEWYGGVVGYSSQYGVGLWFLGMGIHVGSTWWWDG